MARAACRAGKDKMRDHYDPVEEFCKDLDAIRGKYDTEIIPERYSEAKASMNQIIQIMKGVDPDARVKINYDVMFGTALVLHITVDDDFGITNTRMFAAAVSKASTFEICSHTDNTVEMIVSYNNVKRPIFKA